MSITKKDRAVNALITQPTIKDAAREACVSERTLRRWIDEDPLFIERVRAAQEEILEGTTRVVADAAKRAVSTLEEIMADVANPAGARVSAARSILETSMRIFELQGIQRRLEAIERTLNL